MKKKDIFYYFFDIDTQTGKLAIPPKITDPVSKEFYNEIRIKLDKGKPFDELAEIANTLRMEDSYKSICKAGFYYLALGDYLVTELKDDAEKATRYYHYAGHAIKRIEQFNQAAKAYGKAGLLYKYLEIDLRSSSTDKNFIIRSLARAKTCLEEVGEIEKAEKTYLLEQNLRYSQRHYKGVLFFWKHITCFGTSFWRWLIVYMSFISLLFIGFHFLHKKNLIDPSNSLAWTNWLDSLFYTFKNSFSLGSTFVVEGWIAKLLQTINILFSYLMIGLGVAMITRYVKSR